MRTRKLFALFALICLIAACGSDSENADDGDLPATTEPVETVPATPTPPSSDSGDDPTAAPVPTTTPAPTPTEPPLGAGPYPIADLTIAYEHPDGSLDYGIGCQGDTATSSGDADQAGIDPTDACLAMGESDLAERLIEGPPADRICTEQYGGPDVATVTGTLDGQSVDTQFDRTNGCGIDEWDDLAAPILPPARGVSDPDIDPTPALTQTCSSPEGYTISYPEGWTTNDGSVTDSCGQFNPTPFEVPPASDERVAAITAYVDNVAYSDVAGGDSTFEGTTASTTIDGHQALRRSGEYNGNGLYDAGTPVTSYLIDLALGVDDGPGTMFVNVIGVGDFDHDALVPVLDAMAATIEIDLTTTDASVIARFEGGGAPFSVSAQPGSGPNDVCLGLVGRQARGCVDVTASPAQPGLRVVLLQDGTISALAGTAPDDVFLVEARSSGGDSLFSYLPVPVAESDGISAWAMPLSTDDVAELVLRDRAGNSLGSTPLPAPDDDAPEPVAELGTQTVESSDFPASGTPIFLRDVRHGISDGFQRVVFEFTAGDAPSFRVELADSVAGPSGEAAQIEGEQVLSVTMTPASTVDLSGDEAEMIYAGPTRITPSATDLIGEIALVSDFESTLAWGIGVNGDVRYTAAVLTDPLRLVVDVAG